jgi:hypothetical protein
MDVGLPRRSRDAHVGGFDARRLKLVTVHPIMLVVELCCWSICTRNIDKLCIRPRWQVYLQCMCLHALKRPRKLCDRELLRLIIVMYPSVEL